MTDSAAGYVIRGLLEGLAPFLFNRMVDPESLDGSGGRGRRTVGDKEAEAALKVYRDDGGLIWPAWNVKKCLLLGVDKAGLKEGRGSLRPYVEGTVFPDDPARFVDQEGRPKCEADDVHRVVGKIPPRTGAAAIIRRPMLFTGWRLAFVLHVVDPRRRPQDLRRAMDEAGLLVGMGSWRPEYGRFRVVEWSVEQPGDA